MDMKYELTNYDAACHALQKAASFDEVKNILNNANALEAYARQAKDTRAIEWATTIKIRAERRAGEMLVQAKKLGHLQSAGGDRKSLSSDSIMIKLNEINVTPYQSSRWQKLAAVPETQFEQAIAAAKQVAGDITTAAMLRIERANRTAVEPKPQPPQTITQPEKEYTEIDHELDQLRDSLAEVAKENEELRDAISVGKLSEIDQIPAAELITDLRIQIHKLEISLKAVTNSRDSLLNENAELKKQCVYLTKKVKSNAA